MAGWTGNTTFDVFKLPEEHDELRAAIRALAEKEIAPYAAEVDEKSRFPEEALAALNASGFSAVHVPEEYDGQGADSVATCIVIEEVARVCASSSLIPAVNKLGTMGLILRGSEELKKQVLPTLASGEAMASYALSEREAGSDAAAMRTRARADGDDWILNGTKCWITNGGKSTWYTVMAVTDPDKGANGISSFMVHKSDEGFSVGPKERKLGIKGSPTTELYFNFWCWRRLVALLCRLGFSVLLRLRLTASSARRSRRAGEASRPRFDVTLRTKARAPTLRGVELTIAIW